MASFFRTTFDNLLNSLNSTINPTTANNSRNSGGQPHSQQQQGTTNNSSRGPAGFRTSTHRPAGSSAAPNTRSSSRTQLPPGFVHFGPPPHSHQFRQNRQQNQSTTTSSNTSTTGQPQGHVNMNQTNSNSRTHPKRSCNSNCNNNNAASDDVKKVEIEDIRDLNDINSLCTKQLKMILTKHCIDFKGVFEKEILREKVLQLWIDLNERKNKRRKHNTESQRSQDSSDDIDENQLCKICMEREIDCVLLECGHYLSCVTCGRKLKECPVCRQMVTRCVRTFRG